MATSRKAPAKRRKRSTNRTSGRQAPSAPQSIVHQLDELERSGNEGTLTFGRGVTLRVSSLDKVFFPDDGITKGDLMRYYAIVSPFLLPLLKDRPLILKRYPNGIGGGSFFQQNAGPGTPKGVRVAMVTTADGKRAKRVLGGDLATLMYVVQIGAIAVHAWQSRATAIHAADSTTIDLDPGRGVPFTRVIQLAALVKDELDTAGLAGALKTSGSRGLHIAVPLPANTSFAMASEVANRLAARVVARDPELATLERRIDARPEGTIYVDAQQNAEGKSVVVAYSVREKPRAPVSAPLAWRELRRTLRIDEFTVQTIPARLRRTGDLWASAMSRRNTKRALDALLRRG